MAIQKINSAADQCEEVKSKPIVTAYTGNNSDLITNVARLYLKDGDRVADVTYGKGV